MVSKDPTTQSNYLEIHSEHVDLVWTLNFDKKVIAGSATHTLRILKGGVSEVV